MKLPRVRFTVRRMMVAVAVCAAMGGAEATRRRWVRLAREYEFRAKVNKRLAPSYYRLASTPGADTDAAEGWRRAGDHYRALQEKYERAARYPFLPVAPDPPRPK